MSSTDMLNCRDLLPGSLIEVQTKSRQYHIEYLGGTSIRVSGHPEFCPQPVLGNLQGSLDQEGTLELGFIARGMRLIIMLDDMHPITTSRVLQVSVEQPDQIQ